MGIEEHARRLIEGALADLAREGALPPAVLGATFLVDRPKRAEHGDVATNAPLALQKLAQRPPRAVAELLAEPLRRAEGVREVTIAGDLTIKGVTQRISFPAKAGVKGDIASATGKVTIDRTKFGLKYGSKSFFESIGDKAIYDNFDLTFNVIAKK